MNYDQASAIGAVGERRVADLLRSEAPVLGFRTLNNLLLVDDHTTAQLDHVLIDRFGVLVVETKNYHALIRGRSDDRTWTACYSGQDRRRDRFLNPLRQNDRHREMLHRVLEACGRRLPPEYVQSLVVFAGGNVAHLKLDDVDQMRVVPDREVVDYLQARCGDFPPNPGALDAEQVTDLVSLLRSANQASNPEMVELHAENVRRATARFGDRFRRRPAPSPVAPVSPYAARPVYHQDSRYPDGSQRVLAHCIPHGERALVDLLGALLLIVLAGWILFGGGMSVLSTYLMSSMTAGNARAAAPAAVPSGQAPAVGYDVNLALQRLGEVDPRTYGALTNPTRPQLSTTNGLPTYTWEYIEKTSQDSASIYKMSITLDASGHIVGVTSGR